MTIKVGWSPKDYISVRKREIRKVKACYRAVSKLFKNEEITDRFVEYLIAKESRERKPGAVFSESEIALFEHILSVYDYLDSVTIDDNGQAADRDGSPFVRVRFSELFSGSDLLERAAIFF